MEMRKDALVAAAELVVALEQVFRRYLSLEKGRRVGTGGGVSTFLCPRPVVSLWTPVIAPAFMVRIVEDIRLRIAPARSRSYDVMNPQRSKYAIRADSK